ncbi:hypothetical protein Q7C36_005723 [Tachysurus vachellii]|uniref:Uncharacterized protein n=1 Tax=Tachysurus vachellii TaxID=175792 RepID=A0AA88T8A7_TACVA|nr:hypothetical protein Q7C36_005723 [Tachysurus vachellii]
MTCSVRDEMRIIKKQKYFLISLFFYLLLPCLPTRPSCSLALGLSRGAVLQKTYTGLPSLLPAIFVSPPPPPFFFLPLP